MEQQLTKLYDEIILQHNRAPHHYEKRQTAQHVVEAYNPLCGDKFKLYLDIDNGRVKNAFFHGYGCAISKAATSVFVKKIHEKTFEEVLTLIESYFVGLKGDNTEGDKVSTFDSELAAFSAVAQFPERLTCATLSWEAAQTFFKTETKHG